MRISVLISVFVLVFISVSLKAQPGSQGQDQEFSITGFIKDSVSGQALEYASVALFRLKDSTLVNGAITDEKGAFTMRQQGGGKFYLKITFIGYGEQIWGPFMRKPGGEALIDLGEILISPSSATLRGVEIVADKPLIEMTLDKRVVNVEQNLNTSGGTALDVLRQVPSIDVDYEGVVSLRGSSNVTILIDGRPSTLTGADRKAVLEQISASSIETIEIITNPSAKYDPDGMSGIINIVLKKKKGQGLNGMFSVNVGTREKYNGSMSLSYSTDKFSIFGSLDYGDRMRIMGGESHRETFALTNNRFIDQDFTGDHHSISKSGKIGFDWSINAKNTISFTAGANIRKGDDIENISTTDSDSLYMANLFYFNTGLEYDNRNSFDYNLNYRKRFKKPTQEMMIDFSFSNGISKDSASQLTEYFLPDEITPSGENPMWRRTFGDNLNNVFTGKVDYTHPFNDSTKLELGIQSIFRTLDNDNSVLYYDQVMGIWQTDTSESNHFIFEEQVHSAYFNLSANRGRFGLSFGSRFEQAITTSAMADENEEFENTYFSWFPTAALSYKISKQQEFQLSYSKRINRPDFHSLNPYIDYSNYPTIRGGNPYLDPEYIHSVELGYAFYSKKLTLMPAIFYKRVNDVITRYRQMLNDTVVFMTMENFASATSYGVELIFTYNPAKWWKMSGSSSAYLIKIDGSNIETDITGDAWGYDAKINNNITLPYKIEMQLSGFYNGPGFTGQGYRKSFFSSELALKKDFLKNRLAVSIRVSDLFNTMKFGMDSEDDYGRFEMLRVPEGRVFWFGVTYKIKGNYKPKERKRSGDGGDGGDDMGF